jgi:DNA-binding CsgD family transcriptional regulator
MPHLSHRDYDHLLAGVARLYACPSTSEFPRVALSVCSKLIPSDLAGYTEIDPVHDSYLTMSDSADADRMVSALAPAWLRHYHRHPVLQYHERTAAPKVRAIEDFLPLAKWRREPLYNEFFRPLGVLYQMIVPLPRRGSREIGIALNRSRRPFSPRDRFVGKLLQEHLFQAHGNAAMALQLQHRFARLERAVANLKVAVLVITESGHIVDTISAGTEILRRCFGCDGGSTRMLPEDVRRWVHVQIDRLRGTDPSTAPPDPWTVRTGDQSVTLQLYPDSETSNFFLCLREQPLRTNPQALSRLGLTRRESEVLCHVAQGLTNTAIAGLLGISPRTVHKHLERIFVKLSVTTRTEAALRAAAELGLL